MSLPEIKLMLERANVRFARELIAQTRAAHLASAGKWSEKANRDLNAFLRELQELVDPHAFTPKTASRGDLVGMFASLGVASATVPSGALNR